MNWSDNWQYLSKLNWKRIRNTTQLYRSYQRSLKHKKASIQGLPTSIAIEPTTSCNLRCPECPSGLRSFSRPTGMLSPALFENIINQLKDVLTHTTLYFQGEPYLNPDFLNLVKIASKKKIYTSTSTNAHYLTPEVADATVQSGLDRLIISIDGTTQDTYKQYRVGGKLEKVLEGAKNMVAAKKKRGKGPHLIFQFLVVKPNQHQIEEVKSLAKNIGIDEVTLKTAQVYDYENGNPLIPTIDKYSRYKKTKKGTFELKNSLENKCWKMWHSCVITWDGKVVPCCFDKDAHYEMGNLNQHSFRKIWFSQKYNSFRQRIIDDRQSIDICTNCTEGLKIFS